MCAEEACNLDARCVGYTKRLSDSSFKLKSLINDISHWSHDTNGLFVLIKSMRMHGEAIDGILLSFDKESSCYFV
eukprot:SAG11_NODE_23154_length_394_cov_0.708475_1_plen_74_part_01